MVDRLLLNWPLKLLALSLAFGIWISVTGENRIVKDFRLPLEIPLPADHTLASSPPTEVTVRLAGPERAIRRLDPLDLAVRVDLTPGTFGPREIPLSRRNLTGVPRGVQIDFINPDRVSLAVDRKVRQRLRVEPTFVGKPADGYAFYGADVRPENTLVEGPASEVEHLDILSTSPIRLDQSTAPFTVPVAATIDAGPHVRLVVNRQFDVRVVVDATPVERQFTDVPVRLEGQTHHATVSPTTVTVALTAPPELLDGIGVESLSVVADLATLPPSEEPHRVPLRLDLGSVPAPDLARIASRSLEPAEVEVLISNRSLEE
jgi:YbbR domain-containing protein